jgi:LuxR family transcriptional regulator, maltose regulon positive regulatory protein
MPAVGIAHVGMAEVAWQRGELDTGLRHLDEGIAPCRQLIFAQPVATGLATLAWIRQAQGDPAGALEAMDEAARVTPGQEVAGLLNPVPSLGARLLLAQGDLPAAVRWVGQRGLRPDDQPSYPREPGHLLLARVLPAQGRPEQALGLLDRLHALVVAQGRSGSLIEILALRSLALAAGGEEPGRSPPWPRRSRWPLPRATSGCSPTRGRRCGPCSAGWPRPCGPSGPPPPACRSATSPGWSAPSSATPRRWFPAWWSS